MVSCTLISSSFAKIFPGHPTSTRDPDPAIGIKLFSCRFILCPHVSCLTISFSSFSRRDEGRGGDVLQRGQQSRAPSCASLSPPPRLCSRASVTSPAQSPHSARGHSLPRGPAPPSLGSNSTPDPLTPAPFTISAAGQGPGVGGGEGSGAQSPALPGCVHCCPQPLHILQAPPGPVPRGVVSPSWTLGLYLGSVSPPGL